MGLRRRFQRNRDRVAKKLTLESLENRVLLNGDSLLEYAISHQVQARLNDGLSSVTDEFADLESYGQLAASLQITDSSLASISDPSEIIYKTLQKPVADYFASDVTPTVGELVTALESVHEQLSGIDLEAMVPQVSMVSGVYGEELLFSLDINASRSMTADIDLSKVSGDLPLDMAAVSVDVNAGFELSFEFGIELSDSVAAADGFYIKNAELDLRAEIDTAVNTEIDLGMLGVEVRSGSLALTAGIHGAFVNADNDSEGKITRADMQAYGISELVEISQADCDINADLPVYVSMGSFNVDGSAAVSIVGDIWDIDNLDVSLKGADSARINKFFTIDSSSYVNILSSLKDWMVKAVDNSNLSASLPVAKDYQFSDILALPDAIDGLLDSYSSAVEKINAQQFADYIIEQLGSEYAQVVTDYDEYSQRLSYTVSLSSSIEDYQVPVGLNFEMGDLVLFEQAGFCQIDASGSLDFKINILLNDYDATIMSERKLPTNGRLSGDASFTIVANDNEPVNIVVPQNNSNNSAYTLVNQINDALAAAGLTGVGASYYNGYLKINANGSTHAQLTISADENDPASTDLGLGSYMSAKENNLSHISLEDINLSVDASVSSVDVEASASIGFLGVELTDINITGDLGFDLEFVPSRSAVYLTDLLSSADSLSAFRISNDHANVNLEMPTVTLTTGAGLDFNSSPSINVTAQDLLDNPLVNLDLQNFGDLGDLESLAYSQIVSMLENIESWLGRLESTGVLDFDLQVTDKSLTDLFSPAQEFGRLVESYAADPAMSIQQLQDKLQAIFVDYAQNTVGDSGLDSSVVDVDFADNILTVGLNMSYFLNESYELDLEGDLSALGLPAELTDLAFVQASGGLGVELGADVDMYFGIDLTSQVPEVFVKDNSAISFTLNGQAQDIDFDVSLGVLGVHVVDGEFHVDDGTSGHNAIELQLSLPTDETDHRYSISQLASASEFNSLTGAAIAAALPLYFPDTSSGSYLGDLEFQVADVFNPINTTTVSGPDLGEYISNIDIMSVLNTGLDQALRQLTSLFDTTVGSYELPFIGASLKDAAGFLIDFLDNDQYGLTQTLAGIGSIAGVQNALLTTFGPSGFDVLGDVNLDGNIDLSDIEIASIGDNGDFDDVSFSIQLSQQLASVELTPDFDLELPWLDLNIEDTGSVLFELGYDLNLNFGVSRNDGFYIETTDQDEFVISFEASMPDLGAIGNLGFLSLEVGDSSDSPSFFNGSLAVDIHDNDGLLTISDVFGDNDVLSITPEAEAALNLEFITGIEGNDAFPSLRGGLNLGWLVNSSTGFAGELTSSSFSEVQLNLGDYVNSFVEPIFETVNDIIEPVRPIVDALTTEIDFSIASYSVLDILNLFGDSDYSDFISFVSAIDTIDNFVQQAHSIGNDLWLDFGGVTLDVDNTVSASAESWQMPEENVSQQISEQAPGYASNISDTNDFFSFPIIDEPQGLLGMLFGQNPTLVKCDLPDFSFSESFDQFLGVIPVGPIPVTLGLRGSMGLTSSISFGYDTLGLRNAYAEGSFASLADGLYMSDTDSSGRDIPELSVYGSLGFYGQVGGGFDLGFMSAEAKAGVEGGLKLTVSADLTDTDNDGKVRFNEFAGFDLEGEISCYVDLYAKVGASFLGIGGSTKYTLELVDITLVDFTVSNDDSVYNPPVLATMENGTLYLNMGDRAEYALNGGEKPYTYVSAMNGARYKSYLDIAVGSDVSEEFEIVNAGSGKVIVKAWGFEQEYGSLEDPVTSIVANAGAGNDIIELKGGLMVPSYLDGGSGDDRLMGGSGIDTISGGSGNDYIDGGSGDDLLYGYEADSYLVNTGDDTIYGGRGDDHIFGGGGNDFLYGQVGSDEIHGGAGNDTILGETGDDIIFGDAGSDILFGNQGIDLIFGGADNDVIIGGADNDILYGYKENDFSDHLSDTDIIYGDFAQDSAYVDLLEGLAGDDIIYGQGGADSIYGEAGDDTVYAGAGQDYIDGGQGNDLLLGEAGDDTISGALGNDVLYGGAGSDSIDGGVGDDLIDGGSGNDIINGNDGNDLLYGGIGDDSINAGIGDDIVYAGEGNDTVDGHLGDDIIYGDAGNDSLSGGAGNDTIYCGLGNDQAFGQADNDTIYGIAGSNYIWGGLGNDNISGGSGSDLIYGDYGNDIIWGLAGIDTIDGGIGNDTIYGGLGNDIIHGNIGRDRVYGGLGDDELWGDSGNDYIDGGFDADTIYGGAGNDELYAGYGTGGTIYGGEGDDVIHGSDDGSDTIFGDDGDDNIWGYRGNDVIDGNAGRDVIYGGKGDDILYGGLGSDVIVGGADHDILYGDSLTENGNYTDYLYGDFGTGAGEIGSGRDQLYGQAGNDFIYGEGDDDKIIDNSGENTINYGSGEGVDPETFAAPVPTSAPSLMAYSYLGAESSLEYVADVESSVWHKIAGSTSSDAMVYAPVIAVSASGNDRIFAAWVDAGYGKYDIVLAESIDGNWVTVVDGVGSELFGLDSSGASEPSIYSDSNGDILISWIVTDDSGNTSLSAARYDVSAGELTTLVSETGVGTEITSCKISETANGPILIWQADGDIYAGLYSDGTLNPLGGSAKIVDSLAGVASYDIDIDGNNIVLSFSEGDSSTGSVVSILEYNGSQWNTLGSVPAVGSASMPSVKYYNDDIYLSWLEVDQGRQAVAVSSYDGSSWQARQTIDAAINEVYRNPDWAIGSNGLQIVWQTVNTDDISGFELGFSKLDSGSGMFNEPQFTELDNNGSILDNNSSFSIAEGVAGIYAIWQDVNAGISIAANTGHSVESTVAAGESIQQLLDAVDFGPGDVIYLEAGEYEGFEISADDAGVTIIGGQFADSVIISPVVVNASSDITLQDVTFTADVIVSYSENIIIAASDFSGAMLTLSNTDSSYVHNNVFSGSGIVLNGSQSGIDIYGNVITGADTAIEIGGDSEGSIIANRISSAVLGIDIQTAFAGKISENDIADSDTGIAYKATADLIGNIVHDCTYGMTVNVSDIADAPGYYGSTAGNTFTGNSTGVVLDDSYLAGQTIVDNSFGVTGSGNLGGADFGDANIIEYNIIGVAMEAGSNISYNKIGYNRVGIEAGSDQIITHNSIYNNSSNGVLVSGVETVRIINNTIYSEDGNALELNESASEIDIQNNILWSENDYAMYISNNSRDGFFSDYNVLYTGEQGHLVHWVIDFDDILDWQVDVGLFDSHSVGRTSINSDWAKPRFNGMAVDDYSLIDITAGLRFTNPAVNAGNQAIDIGLSADRVNLLANPDFEDALTGWVVSDGSLAADDIDAFDGENYYSAGETSHGTAIQTINLADHGYTNAQIDESDLVAIFGGRLRSALETVSDSGTIKLTFLDSSGSQIAVTELSPEAQDQYWQLAGGRVNIPQGTRQIRYSYIADRQVENNDLNNDAYLDNAFLYVEDNASSSDIGAYSSVNETSALALRYPEMYLDWQRDTSHTIRWDSFNNDDDLQVRIDLYQDTPVGTVFLQNIAYTADDGSYTWLPSDSGIDYGVYGLRVFISLVGAENVFDISTESFNIPENTDQYYVNDGSVDGDQYTTAVGSNRNTGCRPDSPKPNPVNLLKVYSLAAGDELFVDTGDYSLLYPVIISGTDGIGDDEGFVLSGPDGYGNEASFELIDPDHSETATVILDNADYVYMYDLVLSHGYTGLALINDSTYFVGASLVCSYNTSDGIVVESGSSVASLDSIDASNNSGNGISITSGDLEPLLSGIEVSNNSNYGLYTTKGISELSSAHAANNGNTGFYLTNQSSLAVLSVTSENNRGDGLYVSGNVTEVFNSEFYYNSNDGVELANSTGTSFELCQVYANGDNGIYAYYSTITIADHEIYGNGDYAIVAGSNSVVSHNDIHDNGSGIYSYYADLSNNVIYDNDNNGIYANGGKLEYNVVSNSEYGIYIDKATEVDSNVVYSNATGIFADSTGSVLSNNRIYNNSIEGIRAIYDTDILGNVIYSNGLGIYAIGEYHYNNRPFSGTIANNLVYDNINGIRLYNAREYDGEHASIINNTIYQVYGNAVSVMAAENSSSDNVELKNNIITVVDGCAISVDQRSQTAFDSNYNLFDLSGVSILGKWQGRDIESINDWQSMAFSDRNSSIGDPYYVDITGADGVLGYESDLANGSDDNFHLKSLYGSFSSGSLAPVIDPVSGLPVYPQLVQQVYSDQSPAIDRGDAGFDYAQEPANNGGYINIGAYGNTDQAAISPQEYVLITSPQGGELWPNGQQFDITWRSDRGAEVSYVDITLVGESTELTLASGVANDGSFSWQVPDNVDPDEYYIVVTRSDNTEIVDSSNMFAIMEHDGIYYVNIENDSYFADNEYTTAPGNNANSGLTPSSPKSSVRAIIESYDLRPGDIIYVDTGYYTISSNIIIGENDYGFTICGPIQGDDLAIIDHGNQNTGNYVFEFDNVRSVAIKNIAMTNAYSGFYSNSAADILISDCDIYQVSNDGINLSGDIDNVRLVNNNITGTGNNGITVVGTNIAITGNQISQSGKHGIFVDNSQNVQIDRNTISDSSSYGIYVDSSSAKVTANIVSANNIGIYAYGEGLSFPIRVSDNEVYDNSTIGVYAAYNVQVSGNTIYGQQGSNHYGIQATRDASVMYNDIYDNEIGIYTGEPYSYRLATVVGNYVHSNTTGIVASYNSTISENVVYSNTIGITTSANIDFSGEISNNVIYSNSDYGIAITRGRIGAEIFNNTISQSTGNGLKLSASRDVDLYNNIFDIADGYCLEILSDSFAGFSSDYNILHGKTAIWGGTEIDDRADWYYELGFDHHSYSSDPQFTNGYHVSPDSDAVDNGAPTDDFILEMYPNGGRVNIGAYGNTFEATVSSMYGVQLLSPIALDKYEYGSEVIISWRSYGLSSYQSEMTVDLEYSLDNGSSWSSLATSLAMEADGTGSYIWQADTVGEEVIVRISGEYSGIEVSDESSIFQVSSSGNSYYVNIAGDTDFSDNEYTFAAGDNNNSGKSPYYPMSSLSALLDIYDLGAGDIVYIDSGVYTVLNNMVIDSSDAGVTLHGPEVPGHQALFDRNNTASGNNVLELTNAENVVVENLSFTGGYYGIYVSGGETHNGPVVTNNTVMDNASYGIYVYNSPAKVTANTVSANNIGIYAYGEGLSFPIRVSDNEVYDNSTIGVYAAYNVQVSGNTIYGQQGSNHYGIQATRDASVMYNDIYDNEIGIYTGEPYSSRSASVVGNYVHSNTTGIVASYKSTISENVVYLNTVGIATSTNIDFSGEISNNVIYSNSDYGIAITRGRIGAEIFNNTISQSTGNGLKLSASRDVDLYNNIFDIADGYCLEILSDSFAGFSSDYNILHGKTAIWGGTEIDDRADWYYELGFDHHSYSSDPQFTNGYHVSPDSDAVDNGAPTDDFILEMYPNGGRVNIGAYGNTFEATASSMYGVQLLSPIALDKYEYGSEVIISWRSYGLSSYQSEMTVDLEYSLDNGSSWSSLATSLAMEADGTGSYIWQADTVGEEVIVRISGEYLGIEVSDESSIFQVSSSGNSYYVNIAGDTDFSDNEYTFAAGDNNNSGKSPYYPMSSLSALLDIYDLGAGDIVYIDSGVYTVLNNMVIDSSDAGVTLHGPEVPGHQALFDRNNTASGNNVLELTNAENVVVENLSFTGGYYGIYVSGGETRNGPVITNNTVTDNASYGIYVYNSPAKVTANTVSGNDIGIYANGDGLTYPVQVSDNEVYGNDRIGIYAAYKVQVSGNTVYGHQGSEHYGIQVTRDAVAMYNDVYDNEIGIYTGEPYSSRSATVVGNDVYGNTTGIVASYKSNISENKVYSNAVGISTSANIDFTGNISNNVIYSNSDYGIVINRGRTGMEISNNTIYQPVGDAVRLTGGSSNVSLVNNIMAIDTGHCLSISEDSLVGLASDHNLFFRSVQANSSVARVGLTDIVDLSQWQQYSSLDNVSVESDPLFVDMDGADGILGYQRSEIHVNSGLDDNFILSKNSPAIDAGYSWLDGQDDIHDDPGVVNAGSNDYYAIISDSEALADTGTAMGWHSSNDVRSYALATPFDFYGNSYSTLYISTSGAIQLGANNQLNSNLSDVNNLVKYAVIAPFWSDVATNGDGDDIYIDDTQAGVITIRWDATSKADGANVEFAVSLYDNGEIEFIYDGSSAGMSAVIGISSGKGDYKLIKNSELDNQDSTVRFALLPGATDIGAYEFTGSSFDTIAPEIVNTDPGFIHNSGQDSAVIDMINIYFSEPLNVIDAVSASNYSLLCFGANGIEGDADDYELELNSVYYAGSSVVTLDILSGELAAGNYKLVVNGDSMHDISGLALGQDYIREFTIADQQAQMGYVSLEAAPAASPVVSEVTDKSAAVSSETEIEPAIVTDRNVEESYVASDKAVSNIEAVVTEKVALPFTRNFDDLLGKVKIDSKVSIDNICLNSTGSINVKMKSVVVNKNIQNLFSGGFSQLGSGSIFDPYSF